MNRTNFKLPIALLLIASGLLAQNNKVSFSYFEYKGNDAFYEQKIDPKTQYCNPILPGFYPDPSICRRGDDYFLVNSTFSYFPGIPVFHSKDLVHWKQIGNALDRPSQLKLDGLGLSGGVFAPAIEYNMQDETFYLINTVVGGIGNFFVTTKDPFRGWSEPVKIPEINGIDPSFFFDSDGKTYIVYNGKPDEKPKWNGHRAIRLREFDLKSNQVIGTDLMIVNGGVDTTSQPLWIEGPHIYKVKGKYYLIAAEGGTKEGHSQVVFISDKVTGPYLPLKNNPILTQRDLPEDRNNKITSTGHADLIQTQTGDWFAVFLGCRPYNEKFYNTGRETFMLPVNWVDDCPIILGKGKAVPIIISKKDIASKGDKQSGNFTWRDEFNKPNLNMKWLMLRTPREQWWKIDKGQLVLEVLPRSLSALVNPSFIARRQQHMSFEASTSLSFIPKTENELAGMAYFQNEKNYFVLGKTLKNNKPIVVLQSVVNGLLTIVAEREFAASDYAKNVVFSIEVNKGVAAFYYSTSDPKQPELVANNIDITNLSTKNAGGFVGAVVGMYATCEISK
jgi:alpha-N-arabinofuranosidase